MKNMALKALAALSLGVLGGCQGFTPRDDDPGIPLVVAPQVERGPSSQRLGPDGYPLIGAYPRAATSQATAEAVAETQARYANVAGRARPVGAADTGALAATAAGRAAEAASRNAQYARTVEELQAVAREQQRRVVGN
ncbi:hypothetical protein [Aureimonas populi]|uniref:DUF4398 domain-containing protein n=1 Tax=Aureimonas populi TaxID=1701758 RepID=A0ABW5CQA0_9HYPH|nr:hypothetical protein [Aureimonas populi]